MSKKSNMPEIRIKDAWLLRENASVHLNELWGDGEALYSDEYYADKTKSYQKAWKSFEQKILSGMTDILDLSFRQNIIDVYVAPWFHAFSEPMVIGVIFKPDEFVDTLTHELLHRLLTDNTTVPNELFLIPHWEKLFGKQQSWNALVHIPVHAAHKAIYLDVLKDPKRLERDVENNNKVGAKDYIVAWDYVSKHGYKEIINQLKQTYKELGR